MSPKKEERRNKQDSGGPSPYSLQSLRPYRKGASIAGSNSFAAAIMPSMHLLRKVPHRLLRSKPSSPPSLDRRRLATLTGLSGHPKPGEKLHGFTLERTKHVPELQLTAFDLHHDRTGAEYLHVARDDKNNVFSISFKTNPPDNTGVPHILEHTTLCGSEKYSEQLLQ